MLTRVVGDGVGDDAGVDFGRAFHPVQKDERMLRLLALGVRPEQRVAAHDVGGAEAVGALVGRKLRHDGLEGLWAER